VQPGTKGDARQVEEKDVAWCAGLYEGEGNIHLSTQRALMVSIVNVDPELLEPFVTFGGSVLDHSKPANPNHKQPRIWRIGGNYQVESFIDSILPYVRSTKKRAQLELGLEFINFDWTEKTKPRHVRNHKEYDAYYQRFRELH